MVVATSRAAVTQKHPLDAKTSDPRFVQYRTCRHMDQITAVVIRTSLTPAGKATVVNLGHLILHALEDLMFFPRRIAMPRTISLSLPRPAIPRRHESHLGFRHILQQNRCPLRLGGVVNVVNILDCP
jgi:hypothetical protein